MAPERAERYLVRILRALAFGGGAVLMALMAMIVFEATTRYLIGLPFLGGFEMTELAMVLIVFLGLAYCGITGGHVAVDIFARVLDRPAFRWLNALVHLAGAGILGLVAWRTTVYAVGSYRWGDATNMMAIPKYPFQLVTAAGAAIFALVLVLRRPVAQHFGPQTAYALWGLPQEHLARTLLPLGTFEKPQIRRMAEEFGLARVAAKPDSYEICFIPDNDYRGFLQRRSDAAFEKGAVVNAAAAPVLAPK